MAFSYDPPVRYNQRGPRVRHAQLVLQGRNRFGRNFHPGHADGVWGKQSMAAADEARFELGYPIELCRLGAYGAKLDRLLTWHKLPPSYLSRRIARRGRWLSRQWPPLPGRVHFPSASYPPSTGRHGLQPWVAPQVDAIAKHFGLTVTAGWGGHPPHAYYSDHRWGGACDLAGSYDRMVSATFWADRHASGWYRRGSIFRWVGGPAHDGNGIEPGHYNHVHLSWFRNGPATSVFDLPEFR